jgi:multidrug efflux pump subunit AcrA (membrane-fusion protein)
MSKRRTALVAVLGLAVAAGVITVVATTMRVGTATPGMTPGLLEDKRWQAVAPGRVEPRSGQIKVATTVIGLVDKVLVKANDTVFAGEPLIRLSDDELGARLAAAEAQVALRMRARDERAATGKAVRHWRVLRMTDKTPGGASQNRGQWRFAHRPGGPAQHRPRGVHCGSSGPR